MAMGKGSSSAAAEASSAAASSAAASSSCPDLPMLPTIIVFDLDDCLWTPEMHELSGPPSVPVEGPLDPTRPAESELGTVGMKVPPRRRKHGGGGGFDWGGYGDDDGEEIVELYPGARRVLRELATNPKYGDVKIAVASTSLEPSYSRACIGGIEIVEGVYMKDMISHAQIGRSGNLSSEKTSHFRLIHEESGGVPYQEMLFFDDCNWGDHVGTLHSEFGVVGVRTPQGLRLEDFEHGLELYQRMK
mmetsp:Transcript_5567/g.12195  ORF Transcript_5567/g.12195 Transcript_5567/m.12195 type:complete len:246 (+) Transcript_5567:36-773(+)